MSKLSLTFVLTSVVVAGATATSCADPVEGCEYTGTCVQASGGAISAGGSSSGGAGSSSGGRTSGGAGGGSSGGSGGAAGAAGAGGAGGDEGGQGGAGGSEGGQGGEGGSGGSGGSCDTTLSPSETDCWLDDEHAIFVAPTGRDQNSGGRNAPVKTLSKALALAGQDKSVIACAAKFSETITLTDAARLFGGFSCPGGKTDPWIYDAATQTVISSGVAGPALEVRGAGDAAILIEDVAFESGDGVTAGESSVAAYVVDSADVTLRRVVITAGKGADGESAKNDGFVFPVVTDLVGNEGTGTAGGELKQCACPDGTSSRGGGGGGLEVSGGPGKPTYDASSGLGGDTSKDCGLGGTGLSGASAPEPAADAKGASTLGTLTSSGWVASDGDTAKHGAPGQGGGGGAGKPAGGGGGGGCGGCGGKGGAGGIGGGASIALLSVSSAITLEACELTTSDAGDGGKGASGQNGQQTAGGGGDGFGSSTDRGCTGGGGGKGSAGGSGGGAAGGISIAIAYQGTKPSRETDTVVTTGSAGLAGDGGNPGENDGIAGVADEELELP